MLHAKQKRINLSVFLLISVLLLGSACQVLAPSTLEMSPQQSSALAEQSANAIAISPQQCFDTSDEQLALKALQKKKDSDANQKDVGTFSLYFIKIWGRHETSQSLDLFAYVCERTYLLKQSRTYQLQGAMAVPCRLSFEKQGEEYFPTSIVYPGDGSQYASSVQSFCKAVPELAEQLLSAPSQYASSAQAFLDSELKRVLDDAGFSDATPIE